MSYPDPGLYDSDGDVRKERCTKCQSTSVKVYEEHDEATRACTCRAVECLHCGHEYGWTEPGAPTSHNQLITDAPWWADEHLLPGTAPLEEEG